MALYTGLPNLNGRRPFGSLISYEHLASPFAVQGGSNSGHHETLDGQSVPPGTKIPGWKDYKPPQGTPFGAGGSTSTPFGGWGQGAQSQGRGGWWTPTPPNWATDYSLYQRREMPGATYVDPNSAAYRQSMGSFSPSADNQSLYQALPPQYQLTLNQWAAKGGGAYSQAYLDAMRAGDMAVTVFDPNTGTRVRMSGNGAAALIKQEADKWWNGMQSATQQQKQYEAANQVTPFRVVVGGF